MSTKWTDNQLLAINARGGDVLVSAAAGSGKTAVLVERVIQMLTDPVNPISIDRMLIVTYTRAAAAQLKDRISKKLSELITKEPDNKYFRRQLVLLGRANISTVDSFCSELSREFFHALDINRDYKIAESGELDVLMASSLEETLDELYEAKDSEFYELLKCFSNAKTDKGLSTNVIKLYSFLRSHPFFDAWLDEKLSYYTEFSQVRDSIWGKVILSAAKRIVKYALGLCYHSVKVAEQEPDFFSKVSELLSGDLQYFQELYISLEVNSWDDIRRLVNTFVSGKLLAKGYKDHPIKLKVSDNRDIVKDCVKELKSLFESDEAQCMSDAKALYPVVSQMFKCVSLFNKKYSLAKKAKNIADFSDVEHWALELLVEHNGSSYSFTNNAAQIASRFDCVLVDEYQDANEVQDLIFKAVSSKSSLFIVGDAKQSIYAFRQAMPEIFINRKNKYPEYSSSEDSYPAKVSLEKNFRSRKEITDTVNFFFDRLMSEEAGGINYSNGEGLVSGASYESIQTPCVSLHLLDSDEFEDEDKITLEARHIASVIRKQLSDTKLSDGDEKRSCTYGDIAILLRSGKKNSSVYVSELKKYGIPATFESTSGYFDTDEIKLVLSILRVIDNPAQDIPLLATLMSPVFGFTTDDLADIRSRHKQGSLYASLIKSAEEGNSKASGFIEKLSVLRTLGVTMSAKAFINTMYERLGIISVCACLGSESAVSNIRLLSEYAAKFEKGGAKGINAFVSYLDKLCEQGCDLNGADGGNEDVFNAVRIMTVHSSKGLEFPVCILAGTHKRFSSDTTDNVLLHSHLGFAAKRRDKALDCNYNTFMRKALAIEMKRSEMSEELRVLYVALTRAKERLIITSVQKNINRYLASLAAKIQGNDMISPYIVSNVNSISDWLFMGALLHKEGNLLRSIANAEDLEYSNDSSMLEVEIVDSINIADISEKSESQVIYEHGAENLDGTIRHRFDYEYPHTLLCKLPQKVTASEIAHIESSKMFDKTLAKPAFLQDDILSAAQKGTAMHKFLQYCDFEKGREDIKREAERLCGSRLTESEYESLDLEKLRDFLNSSVITDAITNRSLREYRFTVNIDASLTGLVESGNSDRAEVVLQGAVDLVIIKDDGITVVDYKTDRVSSVDTLLKRYEKQLQLYKAAVSACLDMPVDKCIIYSIHLGESKEV